MLSKRSIRGNIQLNGLPTTKEKIVELSVGWTDKEKTLFKKMVSQGGSFSILGNKFTTESHDVVLDSSGNLINIATPQTPTDDDVDMNYLR
jgi:hypothetical protein